MTLEGDGVRYPDCRIIDRQDRHDRRSLVGETSWIPCALLPTAEEKEDDERRRRLRRAAFRNQGSPVYTGRVPAAEIRDGLAPSANVCPSISLLCAPADDLPDEQKADHPVWLAGPVFTLIEPVTRSVIIDSQSPLLSHFPYLKDWEDDGASKTTWKAFEKRLARELGLRKERKGVGLGIDRVIDVAAFKDVDVARKYFSSYQLATFY